MSESERPAPAVPTITAQLELLTQELELALRWQRPCLLLVSYGSEYVRAEAVARLENQLRNQGQQIVWIHAGEPAVKALAFWHHLLEDARGVVFFVDGLAELATQRELSRILDQHSYLFTEQNVRLVFWLTHKEASTLAYQAPVLWTARQRLFELVAAPRPEQVLQHAVESAWQGTGEYGQGLEDPEASIALRENFLNGLPADIESTATRAHLLLTLGVLHWRRGEYERAEELLQNALKLAAKLQDDWFEAECYNARALVQSSLGRHEVAIEAYRQAIRLAPSQIFAWNNLGNLCLKINRNHEAMIAFQKALEHNPQDAVAWTGLGDVYARSEYVEDAIAAYRKAIELTPSLPQPWNGLGAMYARSGSPNEALSAFQKAIKRNDRFGLPWLGMAAVYARQQRYREAARAYQQALALDPQNSSIWNELGCIFIEAGQYGEAIEALQRAVALDRGFGWAYSNLGLAHARADQVAESIQVYLKSLDLLRDSAQRSLTWNRLANSYRQLNDYQKAIQAYQMADVPSSSPTVPPDEGPAPVPPGAAVASPASRVETVEAPSERVEPTVTDPIEISPPEATPAEETPYWIFHPADGQASAVGPLAESPAILFESASGSSEASPATAVQEIGGLSMQMTLPFVSKPQVTGPTRLAGQPAAAARSGKVDTSEARMWNEKGNLLFRSGALEDAIRAYNKAIKHDRAFGWAYTNLGITYLQLGRFAEAVLLLQKSLELLATPRDQAIAWNELGNLYRGLNDYDNAVVAYQKADELDPDHAGVRDTVEYLHAEPNAGNAKVWNELGDSFFKAGAYAEASDCYRKTSEMEPLNGWAFSNLALSLTLQSRFAEAIPPYLRSIEVFKTDKEKADAWNRLGNVYRRLNDYDNAIRAYQNAVKLNNENGTLLTRARFSLLGNCYVD